MKYRHLITLSLAAIAIVLLALCLGGCGFRHDLKEAIKAAEQKIVVDSSEIERPSYEVAYNNSINGYDVRMMVSPIDSLWMVGYVYTGELVLVKGEKRLSAPLGVIDLSDSLVSTWQQGAVNRVDYVERLDDYCEGLYPHFGQYRHMPFFFFDVDFDGEKELIIQYFSMGQRGRNTYEAIKIHMEDSCYLEYCGFLNMEDYQGEEYLYCTLDDMMQFDSVSRTITMHISAGSWGNSWHIWKMEGSEARLVCKIIEGDRWTGPVNEEYKQEYFLTKEIYKHGRLVRNSEIRLGFADANGNALDYNIRKLIRQCK